LLAVAKSMGKPDEFERLSNSGKSTPTACSPSGGDRGLTLALAAGELILAAQVSDFFTAVVPWAFPRICEFSAQSLANTVSAYALVPTDGAEALLEAIGAEVLKRQDTLDATMVLHLFKGFAISSAPHSCIVLDVMRALAMTLAHRVADFSPQEAQVVARICSSFGARASQEVTREGLQASLFAIGALTVDEARVRPPGYANHAAAVPATKTKGSKQRKLRVANAPVPSRSPALDAEQWQPPPQRQQSAKQQWQQQEQQQQQQQQQQRQQEQQQWQQEQHKQAAQNKASPLRGLAGEGYAVAGHSPLHTISESQQPSHGAHPRTPLCRMNALGQMVFVIEAQIDTQAVSPPSCTPTSSCAPSPCAAVTPGAFFAGFVGAAARRPRLPSGAPGQRDTSWRCCVKNGFIHVESANESGDESSIDDDCGSSRRSSSVPSRLEVEENIEDWPKQCPDAKPGTTQSRRYNDLQDLDFEWGGRTPPLAPRDATARTRSVSRPPPDGRRAPWPAGPGPPASTVESPWRTR